MNVLDCADYDRLSDEAAALVTAEITGKRNLLLCAATGSSPTGLYDRLARAAQTDASLFTQLGVMQLDEWGGLGPDDPGSAGSYLRQRLLEPLRITPDRYIAFRGAAPDPEAECSRMRRELARHGPIDLCILGLGINGHIGFNEPGSTLLPHCHVARLSEESRRHAMVRGMAHPPHFGLTLGLQEILAARRILLLVAGEGKDQAVARLLSGEVSTTLPASFLWLHANVDCLIQRATS